MHDRRRRSVLAESDSLNAREMRTISGLKRSTAAATFSPTESCSHVSADPPGSLPIGSSGLFRKKVRQPISESARYASSFLRPAAT
jgi:hypothetical protein